MALAHTPRLNGRSLNAHGGRPTPVLSPACRGAQRTPSSVPSPSAPSCSGRDSGYARVPGRSLRPHAAVLRMSVSGMFSPPKSLSLEKHQSHPQQPKTADGVYSSELACPLGGVEAVMRTAEQGILSTRLGATLQDCMPMLNKVTGVPVLDADGAVVGVISRKDVIRVRKSGGSLTERVDKVMTSPALTIPVTATVQEAADLMLQYAIRRLPVVDETGQLLGVVARSDIFKPLGDYTKAMAAEVAALAGEGSWQIKYLYDGSCPICSSMKELLERQDNSRGRIIFTDISSPKYKPSKNMGITVDEAMSTIHALRPDGSLLTGTDAIRAMYAVVGLGWLAFLMELPLFTNVVDVLYDFISRNRISLGSAMDALLAGKKLGMSKQGVTTCSDVDDGCEVDW